MGNCSEAHLEGISRLQVTCIIVLTLKKKPYFLVNDVENVTGLAGIQTVNYEKLILTELG